MENEELSIKPKYKGIGGWIILVVIRLITVPIFAFLDIYNNIMVNFQPNNWHALTTPGSNAYHHLFGPLLIFELIYKILLIIVPVFLLVLMFKKSRLFPKFMIIYLLGLVVFEFLDIFFTNIIINDLPVLQEGKGELLSMGVRGFESIIVNAAIWVPYFLRSKSVKATFLNVNIESAATTDTTLHH
ncbi:DUF2569 domain-containing protein [Gottfriedia sp. NPDC056225]|uniref:DUF2569 domain-containing protein n=1 Tax=Gottfriedia sp. NPDC056225 TaxID=3345751 RepID=UPI0035DE8AC7